MLDTVVVSCRLQIKVNRNSGWIRRWKSPDMVLWSKNVGHYYFRYYSRWSLLLVSFSAPKVLRGTNLYSYSQRDYFRLNLLFQEALHEALPGICAPALAEWTVSRIDFCLNFTIDTLPYCPNAAEAMMVYAKKSGASYCKTIEYPTGSFSYNKHRAFKVYNKAVELVAHNGDHISKKEDNVVRVEVELRKKALHKTFGNKLTFENIAKTIYSRQFIFNALATYQMDEPFQTREAVFKEIYEKCTNTKQRNNVFRFIEELNLTSKIKTRENNPRRYYYYMRLLNQLKIKPLWADGIPAGSRLVIANPEEAKNGGKLITFGFFIPVSLGMFTSKTRGGRYYNRKLSKNCRYNCRSPTESDE